MKLRNLAPNTQQSYLERVSIFLRYFGRSPELIGPDDIRNYQLHLITEKEIGTVKHRNHGRVPVESGWTRGEAGRKVTWA
jgi:hypothetical protein